MSPRRSPLPVVALVTAAAAILLALTLPDREPQVTPCPAGHIADCVREPDHRVPERLAIAFIGLGVAALLLVVSRGFERASHDLDRPEPQARPSDPPPEAPNDPGPPSS